MNRYLYIIMVSVAFAFAVIFALPVYAQPEVIKSAHQEVIESVDKLSEVKELDLSPEEKEKRELELKKIALDKVVDLSILETENFKNSLIDLEVQEEGIEAELLTLRDKFLVQLEDYLEHFNFVKNGIEASESLELVQDIAGSFNEWREFSYNPEIKKILEFILVFQNKTFIQLADHRFSKIASDLKTITSPKLQTIIREQFLNPAAISIKGAREFNNRALSLLSEYLPEEVELDGVGGLEFTDVEPELEIVTQSEEIVAEDEDVIVEKLTAKDLVINSLQKLKEAYSKFLGLRDLVKSQVNPE